MRFLSAIGKNALVAKRRDPYPASLKCQRAVTEHTVVVTLLVPVQALNRPQHASIDAIVTSENRGSPLACRVAAWKTAEVGWHSPSRENLWLVLCAPHAKPARLANDRTNNCWPQSPSMSLPKNQTGMSSEGDTVNYVFRTLDASARVFAFQTAQMTWSLLIPPKQGDQRAPKTPCAADMAC